MENVDDIVRMAIEDLFPEQTIPDRDNYLPNGTQYKAPDHAIMLGKILIERKSRNPAGTSKLYDRLMRIAADQNAPFIGFGRTNTSRIIESLPDPMAANRKMVDFMMGQTLKAIKESKRKFDTYRKIKGEVGQLNLLVISDNSDWLESTAAIEQFIGRKMGGYNRSNDETVPIDAIFFVKDPRLVIDEQNSYWFKAIIKSNVAEEDRNLLSRIAAALHGRIGSYERFHLAAQRFRAGKFRILIS